jgi:hypothetical protein
MRFIAKDKFKDRFSDPTLRQAVSVADVAFVMFFNDVKAIVKAGVEADISATDAHDNPSHEVRLRDRRHRLKQWLRMDSGLLDYAGDNYANLLRVLVTDPALVVRGLPDASHHEMSTMAFAQSIYDMVASPTRHPLGAPILPKGAFWPAIQVAVAHITVLAPTDPPKFVVNVLRITAEHLKIRFVPFKKRHNGPGRPSHTPVWNSWASLGAPNPQQEVNALTLRPEEAIHRSALDAQMAAMGRDNHVTWALSDIKLRDIATYINRNSLPSDWAIPCQSTGYVLETYQYVRDSYDNKNDVHKLALFIAIILGRCLPSIHAPNDTSKHLKACTTKSETRRLVRSLPWVSKAKTKGSKESHIHVTMFTTFIIALYDSHSPLRKYMAQHQNSLGDLWADKHSACFLPSFLVSVLVLLSQGLKVSFLSRFCAWVSLGVWAQKLIHPQGLAKIGVYLPLMILPVCCMIWKRRSRLSHMVLVTLW